MRTFRRNALFHCLFHGVQVKQAGLRQHSAQQHHVCRTVQSGICRHIRCRQRDRRDIRSLAGLLHDGVVEQHQTARLDCINELLIGRTVHGDEVVRGGDDRRADGFIRDTDGTVCRTATHFRAIGRQPGNFLSIHQTAVCQDLSGKQDALSAEAC